MWLTNVTSIMFSRIIIISQIFEEEKYALIFGLII